MERNIRELKQELRSKSREFREGLSPERKSRLDGEILSRVLALREYACAGVVYTYVSKPIEVDTFGLIAAARKAGKRVAVPRCVPGTRRMEFFEIASADDLVPGSFGVPEPLPERCRPAAADARPLCVVPGFSFDSHGFRLGYGKGYYDRFLADFPGVTAGLCYSGCIRWNLPHGYYDRAVDILVTERYIRRITGQFSGR